MQYIYLALVFICVVIGFVVYFEIKNRRAAKVIVKKHECFYILYLDLKRVVRLNTQLNDSINSFVNRLKNKDADCYFSVFYSKADRAENLFKSYVLSEKLNQCFYDLKFNEYSLSQFEDKTLAIFENFCDLKNPEQKLKEVK